MSVDRTVCNTAGHDWSGWIDWGRRFVTFRFCSRCLTIDTEDEPEYIKELIRERFE